MPENKPGNSKVTVVYALPDEQHLVALEYEPGMTARDAIQRSGLPERFPEIRQTPLVPGLYGRVIEPEQQIEPGARIEISRTLQRDPRELRRVLSSLGMVMGQRDSQDS